VLFALKTNQNVKPENVLRCVEKEKTQGKDKKKIQKENKKDKRETNYPCIILT